MLLVQALAFGPHRTWYRDGAARAPVGDGFQYFDQLVDHFDNTNLGTFRQRFVVNDSVYAAGGPLIVFVGGEGALPETVLGGKYSINYFAEQLGGFMAALEHRYYGASWVQEDMADMRYLSSKQTVADYSQFIPYLKKAYNLPEDTKTVVIGGSYPGNLAGWLRSQLPFAVDAAIATSGPALGELDFQEYMPHAQAQIERLGGAECFGNLTLALGYLNGLLESDVPAFRALYGIALENLGDELSALDRGNVQSAMSGELVSSVQYYEAPGFDGSDFPGTIQQICADFTAGLTAESSAQEAGEAFAARFPLKDAGDLSYDYFISQLRRTDPNEYSDTRSWMWQTCTEFGYYQTTGYEDQIFGRDMDLRSNLQMCYDAFFRDLFEDDADLTRTRAYIEEQVDFTNAWYGARNQPVSHVFYTNGRVDPWSELAVVAEKTWADGQYIGKSVAEWVEEGSHCTDMYLSWKVNDPVRAEQLAKLREWLQE